MAFNKQFGSFWTNFVRNFVSFLFQILTMPSIGKLISFAFRQLSHFHPLGSVRRCIAGGKGTECSAFIMYIKSSNSRLDDMSLSDLYFSCNVSSSRIIPIAPKFLINMDLDLKLFNSILSVHKQSKALVFG